MIQYTTGDLLKSEAQVLVNTVNCFGVMGAGIALQFKKKFPRNYLKYKLACDFRQLSIGKAFVHQEKDKIIYNFPTKIDWRLPSQIEFIEKGLHTLVKYLNKKQFKSIAIPKLGCNNGGLDWNEVKPLMEKYLKDIPNIIIYIYE